MLWAGVAAPAVDAAPLGLPPLPDAPAGTEHIALGKRLFQDPRLSRTGDVACASCHLEVLAFSDGRPVSRGVDGQRGTRNAPSVVNAAYADSLFWDGRADSLEAQAAMPLVDPREHGFDSPAAVLAAIRSDPDYVSAFSSAFAVSEPAISMNNVVHAIAAYERTLVAGDSPFDRWRYGRVEDALDSDARRGYALFTGKGGCASCHPIGDDHALLTDQRFHNVGSAAVAGLAPDLGRYEVSGDPADLGAFKTPTLRNVARTAPYFHDGSLATLAEVVAFFDAGGVHHDRRAHLGTRNPDLKPLGLSQAEIADLVAFLESLTSPAYAHTWR